VLVAAEQARCTTLEAEAASARTQAEDLAAARADAVHSCGVIERQARDARASEGVIDELQTKLAHFAMVHDRGTTSTFFEKKKEGRVGSGKGGMA
jgi:LDH2 family malate/lactate/ureidoglycolate dehydrogenase